MQRATLKKIALHSTSLRGNFPLRLGRQSCSRPAGKRIRLVVTHMAHRLFGANRPHAVQRVMPPLAVALLPIQRSAPLVRARAVPAVRQPQCWRFIPAAAHELQILAVGHQPRRQPKRLQIYVVPRALVVECESVTGMSRRNTRPRDTPPTSSPEPASAAPRSRASRYAGRSGFAANPYFTSVRMSSWCCCSWLIPSSTRSNTSVGSSRVSNRSIASSTCARYACTSSSVGRDSKCRIARSGRSPTAL